MKSCIFLVQIGLILLFSLSAGAEPPPKQQWVARYNRGGAWDDKPIALSLDVSGNVYVTGEEFGLTVKYDPNGSELWVNDDYLHEAHAMVVDEDGYVYITGYTWTSNQSVPGDHTDFSTAKCDPNGSFCWTATFNGWGNEENEAANAIAVDSQGNVYVTGSGYTALAGVYFYLTIKYDPNGNQCWVRTYQQGAENVAAAITVDDMGRVYMTGGSAETGTVTDYVTIKYDANDGNELWVARYDGPGQRDDYATAIAVDNIGNVYVTGESEGSGGWENYATIKYDPNGTQLWVARYDGPGNYDDRAYDLAVDDLGNVYVTGYSYGSGTYKDYATIKYTPDGNELWAARYNGPGNGDDAALALSIDDSGNTYVTGRSMGNGIWLDYATIKYDTNGNQLWVVRYNGDANETDGGRALAVDGSGNVYVTGESEGVGTGYDFATIRYIECLEAIAGDLNNDCKVDFVDIAILTQSWLECNLAVPEACW